MLFYLYYALIIDSSCEKIYLEMYTSILGIPKERLEAFYGKEVIEADRDLVEQGCTEMIELAREKKVAFLVVGDVFGFVVYNYIFLEIFSLFYS